MSGTEIQRRLKLINGINDPLIKIRLKDAIGSSSFNILYKHLIK